jgi:hypothetical protein
MKKDNLLKKEAAKVDKKNRQRARQQATKERQSIKPLTITDSKNHAINTFNTSVADKDLHLIHKIINKTKTTLISHIVKETKDDIRVNYEKYFKNPLKNLFNYIFEYLNIKHPDYKITNEIYQTEEDWKATTNNPGVFLRLSFVTPGGFTICDSSRPNKVNTSKYFSNTFDNSAYNKNRIVLSINPTDMEDPSFDVREIQNPTAFSLSVNPALSRSLQNANGIGHVLYVTTTQQEPVQTTAFVMQQGDLIAGFIVLKLSNLPKNVFDDNLL